MKSRFINSLLTSETNNKNLIKKFNELFNYNAELEKLIRKKDSLSREKLEFKSNLHDEVKKTEKEIEKVERHIINLEKHSNTNHHFLQMGIGRTERKLREKKNELIKDLKPFSSLFFSSKYSENYSEKLENILLLQAKTINHDCSFANKKIKELKEELLVDKEKLEEVCKLQKQLAQLEIERENTEEFFQFFSVVMTAPIEPPKLRNKSIDSKNKDKIIKTVQIISNYNKIHPSNHFPLRENSNLKSSFSKEKLPKRLYDIKIKRVRESNKISNNIEKYAILSYAWGKHDTNNMLNNSEKIFINFIEKLSPFTWLAKKFFSKKIRESLDIISEHRHTIYQYELTFSRLKSFLKAIRVCQLLEIDYLWMDQLCIDQSNEKERAEEIPKMRNYYNNSVVTLIAINAEVSKNKESLEMKKILRTIVNSEWFSRSWTYQEGWLSKQTLFMFDDMLMDGREVAKEWVLQQPVYTSHPHYKSLLEKGTKKIATPVGWVYYKGRYDSKDNVSLSLHEALRGIKKRGRKEPADGIYSILGLLPYGERIKVNYSLETKQILLEVMKEAFKTGYGEYLAWHGEGVGWLPEIDESGSTKIDGGVNIIHRHFSHVIHQPEHIEIGGLLYEIKDNKDSEITKWEEEGDGFAIESGACTKNVFIKSMVNKKIFNINLLGTKKLLSEIKNNNILAFLPNSEEWRSDKPFFILLKKNESMACKLRDWDYFPVSRGEKSTCQRVGLAEISEEDSEKLERILGNETTVKVKDIREKNFEVTKKFFSRLPSKWNHFLDNEEAVEIDFHQDQSEVTVIPYLKREKEKENSDDEWERGEKTSSFLFETDEIGERSLKKLHKELSIEASKQKGEVKEFENNDEFQFSEYSRQQPVELEKLKLESQKQTSNWKSIHSKFTFKTQEEWEKKGFDYEQTKEWIDIGLCPKDSSYAQWLRNEVKLIPEEVLEEENQEALRLQYQEYTNKSDKIINQIEQPLK
ncbi:MAG: HET domain-containing protein [Candidatus Moeniiplasma glomeromycotorum]|nr:HET domain-containing protein [Candidatus Moeniiplasma glomeromycotorum]MCE8169542.1 HET domain-containing protein [Candidatus Moeniiplasma glomeromycotorum]